MAMDAREMRQLASEATSMMAHAAATASVGISKSTKSRDKYQLRILSPLMGRLWEAYNTLQDGVPGQEESINKRLPVLLKQLEAVCKWPPIFCSNISDASHPFPFLHALVQQSPLPNHKLLRNLSDTILRFVSTGGKHVEIFLSNLQKLTSRKNSQLWEHNRSNGNSSNGLIESPDEYPAVINRTLYATLLQYSNCQCPKSVELSTNQEHWARLRLGTKTSVSQDHVAFDMLFSAVPASRVGCKTYWQHLRFRIAKPVRKRAIRFSGEGDDHPPCPVPSGQHEDPKLIQWGSLCGLLGRRLGRVCIKLEVIDGRLHELFDAEKSDQRLSQSQSISLFTLLKCRRLSAKSKILLAYILAKSVWQYYDSDFMKAPWTGDSVHFMREGQLEDTSQEEINPASPCFAFRPLAPEQFEAAEYCQSYSVLHRYPRVLALAVLLVDICRKESRATPEAGSVEEGINNDFTRCGEVVESKHWPHLDLRNEDATCTYKDVVRKCLDPSLFHIPNSPHGTTEMAIQKRRNALYTYVVLPLATLCADLGIIDKLDEIDRLTFSEPNVDSINPPVPALLSLNKSINSSAAWLENLMASHLTDQLAKQFRVNTTLPRIRIAVLDTGYDERSQFFTMAARRNRLIKWKDFVEDQEQPLDCDGHGSHVLSLLMKVAPAADICVARVAKNTEDLQNRASCIAQAIVWATNRDKADANIISMSFGYPEEPEVEGVAVISDAIHSAIHHRNGQVLFFAAAANDGGNQREMFPARHDKVISIRATDHQGAFQHFNPAADALETHVFGTLGTDVPGVWLSTQEKEVCKTGTSIATPIVAGIAATILGYAQLGISSKRLGEGAHMERLRTKRGMSLALMKLSREMREGHFYLYPHEFYRETKEQQKDALLLEVVRLA